MTSSNINSAPDAVALARAASAGNPGAGGTQFMLPATGSTMTQAICAPIWPNASLDLIDVVVVERHGVSGERLRHARRGGHAEGQRTGAGLDQQGIGMAVVAALELHDGVAAGEAARQADGAHGRLGAGTDEAHQLDGRHEFDDAPRERASPVRWARRSSGRRRRRRCTASMTCGCAWPKIIGPQEPTIVDEAPVVGGHHIGAAAPS